MNKTRFFAPLLLALLAGALVLSACNDNSSAQSTTVTPEREATEDPDAGSNGAASNDNGGTLSTEEIVRKLRPSVVQVTTEAVGSDIFGNRQQQQGIGTGVIIDDEGHIVTNNHVVRVDGSISQRITVTLDGDRTMPAEVVGADPQTDLAVLRIDADGLTPAELGDAASLPVGTEVVAIGYALGLEGDPTVTRGVVSAKERVIQEQTTAINDAIQTDASINPGNSGGPLVNEQGEVIGINTAIYQGAQGIGFAISIDLAKSVIDDLVQSGRVSRGFLGIQTQDVTPGVAESLELPVEQGVVIVSVNPGSPADDAGLQAGDVIVRLEDTPIENSGDLLESLRTHQAGETVTAAYYRDGTEQTAEVTLAERPDEAG